MPSKIPVIIPSHNNPTYLNGMLRQLRKFDIDDIIVIDNASTYPPMLDLLSEIERSVRLVRLRRNYGPRYFCDNLLFRWRLPQFFCVTDPDLEFGSEMPADFLQALAEATEKYHVGKAGLALDISCPDEMRKDRITHLGMSYTIVEWEKKFWDNLIGATEGNDPIYKSTVDTTLAVYNKKLFSVKDFESAVRFGGRYTAKHLPWYLDNGLPAQEEQFYRSAARHSWYFRQ